MMTDKAMTKAKTESTELATQQGGGLINRLGKKYGVDGAKLYACLRDTAFKGREGQAVSEAQMMSLMIVADQYGLNPFTKEIFAFPDKANGIVPVVGVDGWARIINEHPQYDGMEFQQEDGESVTCTIYRKDRSHATPITEYMAECKRNTGPWGTHPMRMLRHKAMIQAARLAFGFAGIYDQDEAERILEAKDVEVGAARIAPAMPTKKKAAAPVLDAGPVDCGAEFESPILDAEELPFA